MTITIKTLCWASKMAHPAKALATNPDDVLLIPRACLAAGEREPTFTSCPLTSTHVPGTNSIDQGGCELRNRLRLSCDSQLNRPLPVSLLLDQKCTPPHSTGYVSIFCIPFRLSRLFLTNSHCAISSASLCTAYQLCFRSSVFVFV